MSKKFEKLSTGITAPEVGVAHRISSHARIDSVPHSLRMNEQKDLTARNHKDNIMSSAMNLVENSQEISSRNDL